MTLQLPYLDKPHPRSSHSWIAARLSRLPAGTRILDIGAASGSLARLCKEGGLIFDGIEPNPDWAELASPFYKTLTVATLENCPDACLTGHPVVVCADVLEHLAAPERSLERLARLQERGAELIVSVPNVANLWIRLSLLLGRFDYTERGILDRTHLRFFTRRTIVQMLEASGWSVQSLHATPIPLELVSSFFERNWAGRFLYTLLNLLTEFLPTLFGYQFILVTSRK